MAYCPIRSSQHLRAHPHSSLARATPPRGRRLGGRLAAALKQLLDGRLGLLAEELQEDVFVLAAGEVGRGVDCYALEEGCVFSGDVCR